MKDLSDDAVKVHAKYGALIPSMQSAMHILHINFMMEEGMDRVKATYRDNFKRLANLKPTA